MDYSRSKLFGIKTIGKLTNVLLNGESHDFSLLMKMIKDKTIENVYLNQVKQSKNYPKKGDFEASSDNSKKAFYDLKKQFFKIHRNVKKLLEEIIIENKKEINFYISDIEGASIFKAVEIHENNLVSNEAIYFKIDFKRYFENTSIKRILLFLTEKLKMAKDCAIVLLKILTFRDLNTGKKILSRGFSHSGILAFLTNIDFFLELKEFCRSNDLLFSVYVDDIFFTTQAWTVEEGKKIIKRIKIMAEKNNLLINPEKIFISNATNGIQFHHLFLVEGKLYPSSKMKKKMKKNPLAYKGYKKQINKFNSKIIKK